jgi:hypothetical protein
MKEEHPAEHVGMRRLAQDAISGEHELLVSDFAKHNAAEP